MRPDRRVPLVPALPGGGGWGVGGRRHGPGPQHFAGAPPPSRAGLQREGPGQQSQPHHRLCPASPFPKLRAPVPPARPSAWGAVRKLKDPGAGQHGKDLAGVGRPRGIPTSLPGAPFLPLRAGRQWDPWQHPDGCRTPGPRPVSPQRWRPPGTRCRCAHLLWCRQRGSRYDLLGPCPPQGEGIVPGPSEMPQPFLQQTFAFSVRWSDNSDTFARRSWDEFRGLHVSKRGDPGFLLR